jgi:formylglycine-generating enzyme required for sulfatase activity
MCHIRWFSPVVILIVGLIHCSPDRDVSINPAGPDDLLAMDPIGSMLYIEGGTFDMGWSTGTSDERPVHPVSLDPFAIGAAEVTNGEYRMYVEYRTTVDSVDVMPPPDPISGYFEDYPDHPVVNVTWLDAVLYCNWLSEVSGLEPCYGFGKGYEDDLTKVTLDPETNGFHLPTEAQWERAARGGLEGGAYPWGDEDPKALGNNSQYSGPLAGERLRFSGARGPLAVGSIEVTSPDSIRPLNGFFLVDIGGNVWEWCSDFYHGEYYSNSPAENPEGPGRRDFPRAEWNAVPPKVIRGGGYNASATEMRCSNRDKLSGMEKRPHVGFRIARNL